MENVHTINKYEIQIVIGSKRNSLNFNHGDRLSFHQSPKIQKAGLPFWQPGFPN